MEGRPRVLADRYRLTDAIGRGGMADVYSAEDTQSGTMVAVKVMRVGDAADPDRFAAEMRILDRLSHPAIVPLFDTGRTPEDSPYFVMQLIEGESLSTRLREEGPLPEIDLIKVACRVAGALSHAHDRGVVHRDIKPANILIDESGRGFLTDFGVARLVDSTMVTQAGTTIGTAAYLAPEQLQHSAVSPAADIYSLGLVLIEAFTGRRAFQGAGAEAAMARLGRDPSIPEDLPDNWRGLLLTMTRRNPDRRPAAAVVEAVLRGRQPPPPLDHDELAARSVPIHSLGDDLPTTVTPLTGDQGGGWDPPGSGSARFTPPAPPQTTRPPPSSPTSQPQEVAEADHASLRPSRALVIGSVLTAIVVLFLGALSMTIRPSADDPVAGSAPVDEVVRELLTVLAAAETLRASDEDMSVFLRLQSEVVVEAINEERWEDARRAVTAMDEAIRDGSARLDIQGVAVTPLLEALGQLDAEIEVEIKAAAEPTEGAGTEVDEARQGLLASRRPSSSGVGPID